jgi:hypothetical protein
MASELKGKYFLRTLALLLKARQNRRYNFWALFSKKRKELKTRPHL